MARSRNRAQRTQEEIDNDARVRWERLCYEEEKRQQNLARFQLTAPRNDSDDEGGALCPKYDRILSVQGADRVLRMCNFLPVEFERLWDVLEDHVLAHWNVGRGKKSIHSPKDILFMTIGALKHCGNWDVVSSMFEIDPSPFQKMVRKFLSMLEPFLYDTFVVGEERRWKMKKLTLSGHSFKNFPSARYATDITFQQSNRPTGGYSNAKKYFSGKHHLYGYKVEVSVLPTGAAINSTNFEPGAVADVTMFRDNGAFHRSAMRKLHDEADLSDDGPLSAAYRNDWVC
ncbi:hypothetical protein PF011_g8738 [Phytophthora fragariae]|uniref:DDE Tnp4 domain-containing protein n=1 Tax=Phytophthora fragariae TaxID=53985 RepID=A0A6A3L4J9_9STRA|nr:hypothetical protein PF011_g8738 [Phytophthora fragariae]